MCARAGTITNKLHGTPEDQMSKTGIYIVSACLVLAILAAAGLGIWGYQLNARLASTQRELASLQGDRAQLASTLDQTKAELARSQADLATANADQAAWQAKLDAARTLLNVLDGIFVTPQTEAEIEKRVNATKDVQLIQLWDEARSSTNLQSATVFISYLVKAVGLSLQ